MMYRNSIISQTYLVIHSSGVCSGETSLYDFMKMFPVLLFKQPYVSGLKQFVKMINKKIDSRQNQVDILSFVVKKQIL